MWKARRAMFQRVLSAARADVVCLQEIDVEHWPSFWRPLLHDLGFVSHFSISRENAEADGPSTRGHGIVIAWSSAVFGTQPWAFEEVHLMNLTEDGGAQEEGVRPLVVDGVSVVPAPALGAAPVPSPSPSPSPSSSPSPSPASPDSTSVPPETPPESSTTAAPAVRPELAVTKVIQVLTLRHVESQREVVVTNMHMFWNPRYNYVRFRHLLALVRAAHRARTAGTSTSSSPARGLLMAGDFNLMPESFILSLFARGTWSPEVDLPLFITPPEHGSGSARVMDEGGVSDAALRERMKELARAPEHAARLAQVRTLADSVVAEGAAAPMLLRSAFEVRHGREARFTNRIDRFVSTLDYVFLPNELVTATTSSQPRARVLDARLLCEVGDEAHNHDGDSALPDEPLPTDAWPSDHVALWVEVEFE
jgi:mRNA deadenylase 3'-5' endonuclease subunit Ccr4